MPFTQKWTSFILQLTKCLLRSSGGLQYFTFIFYFNFQHRKDIKGHIITNREGGRDEVAVCGRVEALHGGHS